MNSQKGSDKALTRALADMKKHGAPMNEFSEEKILAAANGTWTSDDGKYKLIKHKSESYNAEF